MKNYISGVSHVLGEHKGEFNDIEEFEALIKKFKLVNNPNYWDWGNYYSTEKTVFELADETMKKTLSKISIPAKDIDLVFFCSTGVGVGFKKVNAILGGLLHSNGIDHAEIVGHNFGGCTSIFYVSKIAKTLLKEGSYKNILVVTADKVPEGYDRMYNFGIYCDSASCFLISAEDKSGYELKNIHVGSDTKLMNGIMENRDSHFAHLNKIHTKATDFKGFKKEKVEKVFMTNLFKPILNINLSRIGYKKEQHFYKNIKDTGHCFASDPLVNLSAHEIDNPSAKGDTFLLGAMASGHAGFAIIQKI